MGSSAAQSRETSSSEGGRLHLMRSVAVCLSLLVFCCAVFGQESRNLTPVQIEIEKQRQRLGSSDQEERRDALLKLGTMRLADASAAAVPALQDPSPIVKATAAKAILSIGADKSASLLIPLLNDKDEFVRREAAYALGLTHSAVATQALSERLLKDKEDGVRGAAAVALGEIADEAAVVALVGTLAPELSGSRRKREQNVFVLRAAATALGQIKSQSRHGGIDCCFGKRKIANRCAA